MTPPRALLRLGAALGLAAVLMLAGHEVLHAGHGHAGHAERVDHCCLCHAAVATAAAPVLAVAPPVIRADAPRRAAARVLDRAPLAARPRSPPSA